MNYHLVKGDDRLQIEEMLLDDNLEGIRDIFKKWGAMACATCGMFTMTEIRSWAAFAIEQNWE